jgi:hypothetical protein
MGGRYFVFRSTYEAKRRVGLLKKKFPSVPPPLELISLNAWRANRKPFISTEFTKPFPLTDQQKLSEEVHDIKNGYVTFFSHEKKLLGNHYDWVTNPDTGYRYSNDTHWSQIQDYSKEAGDIKYVWEKSRFSFIYPLLRLDRYTNADQCDFILTEILDWVEKNPVNCGPNWRCSQEISLRSINWLFFLYYYADHTSLTEEKWEKIIHSLYWMAHHVYENIDFSRIAVRNNHAITETLYLYIFGTLFPQLPGAAKWKEKGKKWFEEEIAYQVYTDGTFLQFSMNYHRVVIQLFTVGFLVADANGEKFNDITYERAYKSLNFLYQCQELSNGYLPNYGANDGAIFFPLNSCHYRDYRPQLNVLHEMLTGNTLYLGFGPWQEDADFLNVTGKLKNITTSFLSLVQQTGIIRFDKGGYYLIRETSTLTFLRCAGYKDRPGQSDNLHLDIWVNGENILLDAGSYKYNSDEATLRYFMGSEGHNTVMLDGYDQMLKGSRFIWYYWPKSPKVKFYETAESFVIEASSDAFKYLSNNIRIERTIRKPKGENHWFIIDTVRNKPKDLLFRQVWHTIDNACVQITPEKQSEPLQSEVKDGKYSSLYGMYIPCKQMTFISDSASIATEIRINR